VDQGGGPMWEQREEEEVAVRGGW